MSGPRVVVIGLDCATPQLVFEQWRQQLPTLASLMETGAWGRLRSCHPPITVPAWSCMMTGYDAGQLGFYGFRNRKDHSYDGYAIATSAAVQHDRVWNLLDQAGKRVILLGVPQTYPITPLNGVVVSDFLTPSTASDYVYPASLKPEIERVAGGYVLDVAEFRTEDKAALLQRVYDKTTKHFAVAKHLAETQPWDFFMMVEMGTDRIHHGFWSFMAPDHPKYVAGNPFEHAIRDYYRFLDREIAELLKRLPPDAAVFVVSDHGARTMEGGLCFNEWLIQHGWLTLKQSPAAPTPISKCAIDWDRTRAWSDGGYYARIFLNVRGREPQGVIAPDEYERARDELIHAIEGLTDHRGRPLGSRAHRPEELYREVRGVAPDLIAYFGDLRWRSVGTVGGGKIHTFENDTGPDEANHDWDGIFIGRTPTMPAVLRGRQLTDLKLQDVAPTLLALFGLEPLPGGHGTNLLAEQPVYTPEEEQEIVQRLSDLGYI